MMNHPGQDAREGKPSRQIALLIITILISIILAVLLLLIQFAYPRLQIQHADRLAEQGDYPAALALYQRYDQTPESRSSLVAASLDYAVALFDQGQFDQADTFLAGLDHDERFLPRINQIIYWRGRCAEADGRYRSAAGYFQRCLDYTDAAEKRNGQERYQEVSLLLAREYEDEGKPAQAYQLYNRLSDTVPEAAAKADLKKTEMIASFQLLQEQFDQSLEDLQFTRAYQVLHSIDETNETYSAYFSDDLVSCKDFDQMTYRVIRTEKYTQIQSWLEQFEQAFAEHNDQTAFAAIQEIEKINTACQEETGSFLVSEDELQSKHDVAARQVLAANLIDQLNTDRVGAVSLRLGRTPDSGAKTSLVPAGSAFGLSIVNIKTEQTLQVKWFRREIPYLKSELEETLVLVSKDMVWQPGISWYTWAEADGEPSGFIPGFYAVDLYAKNDAGEDERVSRTFFQILETVPATEDPITPD